MSAPTAPGPAPSLLPAASAAQQQICPRRLPLARAWAAPTGLLALCLGLPVPLPARAVPSDGINTPLPTRIERFDPDPKVCRPQAIRDAFIRHLQPWSDQPPAVLAQLRHVQVEMTRATLRRCVNKGLLAPAEATQLSEELGLSGSPAAVEGTPAVPSAPEPGPAAQP